MSPIIAVINDSDRLRELKQRYPEINWQSAAQREFHFDAFVDDSASASWWEMRPIIKAARAKPGALRDFFCATHLAKLWRQREAATLVDFQRRNKLWLMAIDPRGQKQLGRISAQREAPAVRDAYAEALQQVLVARGKRGRHVNALTHALGFLKEALTSEQNLQLREQIEAFRQRELSLAEVIETLAGWSEDYQQAYLYEQSYLHSPRWLLELFEKCSKGKAG